VSSSLCTDYIENTVHSVSLFCYHGYLYAFPSNANCTIVIPPRGRPAGNTAVTIDKLHNTLLVFGFLELAETESTGLLYRPRMMDDDECRAVGGMIGKGS
jgi:hypothetical protein